MSTTFFDIPDGRLEARQSRSDGPLVVMLHGNSSSAATFAPVLAGPLGQRFRLVSLSLPGHGASTPARDPESAYAVPALARLICDVIARWGATRYALVGHSLGGHIFSEALPGLPGAAGLVLISAPPLSLSTLPQAFAPDPVGGALFKGELNDAEVACLVSALLGGAARNEAIAAQLDSDVRRTDIRFRPSLGKSIMTGRLEDETAIVAATRVPVALVYGTDDVFLRREYQDSVGLGAVLGTGRFPIAGAGHSPHLERPDEVHAVLGRLLDEAFARG